MTPLELQSIQSREFEAPRDTSFKAVMSVLQDLGYILQSADLPSGFISAVSPTRDRTGLLELFDGSTVSANTAVTATFMSMPSGTTRIRLNFVERRSISGEAGQTTQRDRPVLDPDVYQNAWEKVDETLFMLTATSDLSRPAEPGPAASAPES
ncbi:MAG: hypothetical protein ACXIUO_04035 [Erythrobacter sp.]